VDGLNLYAYARNNPVTLCDPTGLQSVPEQVPRQDWADIGDGVQLYYDAEGVPRFVALDGVVDYDHPLRGGEEVITIHETAPSGSAWHAQAFQPASAPYDLSSYLPSVDTGNAFANVASNGLIGIANLAGGVLNVFSNGFCEASALPAKAMVAMGWAESELDADRMLLFGPGGPGYGLEMAPRYAVSGVRRGLGALASLARRGIAAIEAAFTTQEAKAGRLAAADDVVLLHGTTRQRGASIIPNGPDPAFVEPGGGPPAGSFSTAPASGEYPMGSPEAYAAFKAALFPQEGGPAIVRLIVPRAIVQLAIRHEGEVRFAIGHGLEELLDAWTSLVKSLH